MGRKIVTKLLILSGITISCLYSEITTPKFDFHCGIEQGELLQNNYNNLGIRNYTLFCGQRLHRNDNHRWGWRLLSINVELSKQHLRSNQFIGGDREGLGGNLCVQRFYIDYYPAKYKNAFFVITPVLSLGLGYHREYFIKPATGLSTEFSAFYIPFAFRLNWMFGNCFFLETPFIDLGFHSRRTAGDLGGTIVNYPERLSVFLWINTGIRFPL